MRLQEFFVDVVELPLHTPFRTSLRLVEVVEDVRVTLRTDDGERGLGSASPTAAITGETAGSIYAALTGYILPQLSLMDLSDRNGAYRVVQRALMGNSSAKAAADIALHDLFARHDGMSVLHALGGGAGDLVTDSTVSLAEPAVMERQARGLLEKGFTQLKIKVGGGDGLDAVRVRRIREMAGTAPRIWIDPNQAWSVRETLRYAAEMAPWAVEFIEQPLPAHDLGGMAEVRRHSALPIAADESVYGVRDLMRVLELGAADILNVKLMKAGGLTPAALLLGWAREAGMELMVGSMMEGPASVAAACALARAFACPYADLDAGYFLADAQAEGGVAYNRGRIEFPENAGLGLTWSQGGGRL